MDKSSFQRLESLFHEATALPGGARAAFVERECAGDAELRAALQSMLTKTETGGGLLEVPVLEHLEESLEGVRAGRWKVGRRIGEGGLGVVHEAEADGVPRAAIKFLRPGLDAGSFRRRFVVERKILAALDHPHIARLLDGGIDAEGRPFLVMEYAEGLPLDQFVSAGTPSKQARLLLFRQVCQAVRYLHASLVALGDLKPSNIMVNTDGDVKLLDFGAAKLLAGDTAEQTTLTRAFLTPHYASLEQKTGAGPSVAWDIYSLGLILGEMVGADDGDLAAIVSQATREEAGGRYQSASELDLDVERAQRNLPVHARTQDARYRARKFVQRNVAGVAASSSAIAALLTAGVFFWRDARRDQENLVQMRGLVRSVLDSAATPFASTSEDRKAIQGVLQTTIAQLEKQNHDGVELELAAAWRRLATSKLEEGQAPEADAALEKSRDLAEKVWQRRRDPLALESKAITLPLLALSMRHRANASVGLQRAHESIDVHEQYKRTLKRKLPPSHPYYRLLVAMAPELVREGKIEQARLALSDAAEVGRAIGARDLEGRALIGLARLAEFEGKPGARRGYCAQALKIFPQSNQFAQVCSEDTTQPEFVREMAPDNRLSELRAQLDAVGQQQMRDTENVQLLLRTANLHAQMAKALHEKGQDEEGKNTSRQRTSFSSCWRSGIPTTGAR